MIRMKAMGTLRSSTTTRKVETIEAIPPKRVFQSRLTYGIHRSASAICVWTFGFRPGARQHTCASASLITSQNTLL